MDGNAATALDIATARGASPDWRTGRGPRCWSAARDGVKAHYGPESLLRRCPTAPDLPHLAGNPEFQHCLVRLSSEELADARKRVMPPLPENPS